MSLIGSFGLVPAGLARGCFFALLIVLLVVGSLVVAYITSTDLPNALDGFWSQNGTHTNFKARRLRSSVLETCKTPGDGETPALLSFYFDRQIGMGAVLRPKRERVGVPGDDIAMVFSLALRFIPVTAEEFGRVHDAQWARGASFAEGGLWDRLRAWQTVLIPLFVGLFRRADSLAVAMDARCYGAPDAERTSLAPRAFSLPSGVALVVGLAACAGMVTWL